MEIGPAAAEALQRRARPIRVLGRLRELTLLAAVATDTREDWVCPRRCAMPRAPSPAAAASPSADRDATRLRRRCPSSIAATSCDGPAQRAAGSGERPRTTIRRTHAGTRHPEGGGVIRPFTRASRIAAGVRPANGRTPKSHSYIDAHSENTSERASASSPSSCSGAM